MNNLNKLTQKEMDELKNSINHDDEELTQAEVDEIVNKGLEEENKLIEEEINQKSKEYREKYLGLCVESQTEDTWDDDSEETFQKELKEIDDLWSKKEVNQKAYYEKPAEERNIMNETNETAEAKATPEVKSEVEIVYVKGKKGRGRKKKMVKLPDGSLVHYKEYYKKEEKEEIITA